MRSAPCPLQWSGITSAAICLQSIRCCRKISLPCILQHMGGSRINLLSCTFNGTFICLNRRRPHHAEKKQARRRLSQAPGIPLINLLFQSIRYPKNCPIVNIIIPVDIVLKSMLLNVIGDVAAKRYPNPTIINDANTTVAIDINTPSTIFSNILFCFAIVVTYCVCSCINVSKLFGATRLHLLLKYQLCTAQKCLPEKCRIGALLHDL